MPSAPLELPRLHLRFKYRPDSQGIPATACAKLPARKTLKSGGRATPDFRLSAAQKVFGVAPARCWFAVRAFFGKCETASLLADRISVLGEVGFTLHLHPRKLRITPKESRLASGRVKESCRTNR